MSKEIDFAGMPWNGVLYSFPQGEVARQLVETDEFLKAQIEKTLWYNDEIQTYEGSNFPLALRFDSIYRQAGLRVATLRDTNNSIFKNMILGKHYADTPAIIIQSEKDKDFPPNEKIIQQVQQIASDRKVEFVFPCRVTGLDAVLSDSELGFDVVARDDFAVVQDERLDYNKFNGKKFTEVDENSFPIIDKNGLHTWYLLSNGSARVCRSGSLDAFGGLAGLACSVRDGRVASVAAEGGASNFFATFVGRLQEKHARQMSELERAYAQIVGKE